MFMNDSIYIIIQILFGTKVMECVDFAWIESCLYSVYSISDHVLLVQDFVGGPAIEWFICSKIQRIFAYPFANLSLSFAQKK